MPALNVKSHCAVLNREQRSRQRRVGLSKAWGLPGLRVGWVASHDASVLSQVLELRDYTTM